MKGFHDFGEVVNETPVALIFVGIGQAMIASTFFGSILILSGPIINPSISTSQTLGKHFSGFTNKLFSFNI